MTKLGPKEPFHAADLAMCLLKLIASVQVTPNQAKPASPTPDCRPIGSTIRCLTPSLIWKELYKKSKGLQLNQIISKDCAATVVGMVHTIR